MSKAPLLTGAVAFLAVVGIAASPLGQGDTIRTKADFEPLPGAPAEYDDVEGWGKLARVGDLDGGSTQAHVKVSGLRPDTTYPAHLHAGSCDQLGGHYMDDPSGPTEPPNELWPKIETKGNGTANVQVSSTWFADDAEGLALVIHHHTAGADGKKAKVLCADV